MTWRPNPHPGSQPDSRMRCAPHGDLVHAADLEGTVMEPRSFGAEEDDVMMVA